MTSTRPVAPHTEQKTGRLSLMFSSCFEWISPDHHSVCDTPFSWQSMPLRRDVYCFVVMKDFESVAIEAAPGARKVGSKNNSWDEQGCQQQE